MSLQISPGKIIKDERLIVLIPRLRRETDRHEQQLLPFLLLSFSLRLSTFTLSGIVIIVLRWQKEGEGLFLI